MVHDLQYFQCFTTGLLRPSSVIVSFSTNLLHKHVPLAIRELLQNWMAWPEK